MREFGECGSTRELKRMLAFGGVSVSSLRECQGRREALETEVTSKIKEAEAALSVEIEYLERALDYQEVTDAVAIAKRSTAVESRLLHAREAMASTTRGNPITRMVAFGRSLGLTLSYEVERRKAYVQDSAALRALAEKRRQVAVLRAHPDHWIRSRTADVRNALRAVEAGMEHESFAGAIGEEIVAAELRKLGDGYTVVHDVNIKLRKPIRLFGERQFGAQVDHVVVGPRGVFAIETKNWSAAYANSAGVRDPYVQAARAAFAVRCALRDAAAEQRVVAILAHCGALPPPTRADVRVKVVRADQVCAAVSSGHGLSAASEDLTRLLCTWSAKSRK